MKKKLEPTCKQCRREGKKLLLKGERCNTAKCAIVKRNYPPGLHGPKGAGKLTDYGLRLREKQQAKRMYNLTEKQLRTYFDKALHKEGDTAIVLSQMLEGRFDNLIYRLGFAPSRSAARQMVSHGMFMVNGKNMNVPSYQVKGKDEVTIKKGKEIKVVFKNWPKQNLLDEIPGWVHVDTEAKTAKVLNLPVEEDLKLGLDMNLIIEFYAR